MADQEPQGTSQSNGESTSNEVTGVGEAAQLPERIRVHALAKILGTTSKRILAHLTELGAPARSAHSSLDRTVAESVREALTPPADEAGTAPAPATGEGAATAPDNSTESPGAEPATSGKPAAGAVDDTHAAEVAESALPDTTGRTTGAAVPSGAEPAGAAPAGPAAAGPAGSAGAAPAESAGAEPTGATEPAGAVPVSAPPTDSASGDPKAAADIFVADTAAGTTVEATASVEVAQTPPAEPAPRTSLFTSPFQQHAAPAEQPVFESAAVVAAPLFLPPDAAAAEEARRKRRAEREVEVAEQATETTPAPAQPVAAADTDADTGSDADDEHAGDDQEDGGRSRRRRRGRRGRGRGRGEQHADNDSDDESDSDDSEARPASGDSDTSDAESGTEQAGEEHDDESGTPAEGSTRRRRRRRRRKGGEDDTSSDSAEDDPPNTVVHEREPRNKRRVVDEVQGISGSTRLEAKRQRRRDGREAGRRRPPILTESEFLARRESVDRVMVVREKIFPAGEHSHSGATTQVAVLEDNILVEHFVTNTGTASMVGNVYLGKVQNVLPSMEAAFVDIGRGRNGVLYAGEVNWEAAGLGGRERKIEQALKPGDTVLVQVSKDPVGHKGARLTTQISLAGRFLVYVPGGSSTGISRKLPDTERKRLKEILRDIVPQDAGVIIRTASEGVSENELARDVERLQATWKTIEKQAEHTSAAPKTLYEEPDLLVKVVRDLFNEDFSKLVIEGDRAWTTVENYVRTVAPDMLNRVERYENNGGVDVFGSLRIDEQLAKALDRKVWLPSGGTLVIDRTEAMTVIDVNTGKFTGSGGSNLEETVTRNNLEAAEEIVRQMRLRDIGGMIVVDFIDMVLESNRDLVLRRLTESLGRDRTRHQVSEVTSLGLVQMTRKKLGTGLVEAFSTTCEHCHGRGIIVHNYPVETAPAEEGSNRREGRRRRKDKDKDREKDHKQSGEKQTTAVASEVVDAHAEEEAAAKRAHPVALAMASHHGEPAADDGTAGADEVKPASEAAATAAPVVTGRIMPKGARADATEPAVTAPGSGSKPKQSKSKSAPAGSQTTTATEQPAKAGAAAPARESAAVAAPDEQSAGARRGRRRVARTTAAPAADNQGAVFVLTDSDADNAPKFNLDELAPAEVTPRARVRRRAAGRSAGAPETSN